MKEKSDNMDLQDSILVSDLNTSSQPLESKKIQESDNETHQESCRLRDKRNAQSSSPRNRRFDGKELPASASLSSRPVDVGDQDPVGSEAVGGDSGRERLKRHRVEVGGRVWIPDIWGQEELLKDWIDCSAFDASLVPTGIMSARSALVEEGRRASSGGVRIENRC